MSVITGIIVLSNLAETSELKRAIESKDGLSVYQVYWNADPKKRLQYDDIIGNTLQEIQTNLNEHDFDADAEALGADDAEGAVALYLGSEYGTLLNSSGSDLSDCISSTNEAAWDDLWELYYSKEAYCAGIGNFLAEDYDEAIDCFSEVLSTDSEYNDAITRIGECADGYIQAALAQVDAYVQDGDIDGGMELLRSAQAYLESVGQSSAEVQEKMNTVMTTYADSYMQKAETEFQAGDVNAAVGNVEAAIAINPNGDYQAKLDEYKMYLPLELYKEENIFREEDGTRYGSYKFLNGATSNDNREFTIVIQVNIAGAYDEVPSDVARLFYNLNGNYDTASGVIFLGIDYKSYQFKGYFEAYGDGKLLYTSPTITTGVLPQEFSFNVSGVHSLEIRFCGAWGDDTSMYFGNPQYCISNFVVQKNLP